MTSSTSLSSNFLLARDFKYIQTGISWCTWFLRRAWCRIHRVVWVIVFHARALSSDTRFIANVPLWNIFATGFTSVILALNLKSLLLPSSCLIMFHLVYFLSSKHVTYLEHLSTKSCFVCRNIYFHLIACVWKIFRGLPCGSCIVLQACVKSNQHVALLYH